MLNDEDKQLSIDDPEKAEKISFIQDLIGLCFPKRSIIHQFRERYQVSPATAYSYFNMAAFEMRQELQKSREQHIAESVQTIRTAIKRAGAKGDNATVVNARKYLDAVVGLNQPLNETGNSTNGDVAGTTPRLDEESLKALGSLIAGSKAIHDGAELPPVDAGERQEDRREAI